MSLSVQTLSAHGKSGCALDLNSHWHPRKVDGCVDGHDVFIHRDLGEPGAGVSTECPDVGCAVSSAAAIIRVVTVGRINKATGLRAPAVVMR